MSGKQGGWFTAVTARDYRKLFDREEYAPFRAPTSRSTAFTSPEMAIDIKAEAARLKGLMDKQDNVNILISEGAGLESIVAEMEAKGQEVLRDAFGHVKLDAVNPGKWFGEQFAK